MGGDQVRAHWSAVFKGVPDFRAELIATAVESGGEGIEAVVRTISGRD